MEHSHRRLRDVAVGHRDDKGRGRSAEELVESTTIVELESTVKTESDGVVAEEIIRDSMMKL